MFYRSFTQPSVAAHHNEGHEEALSASMFVCHYHLPALPSPNEMEKRAESLLIHTDLDSPSIKADQ